MEKLLIRCSALGNIMHFDSATQITEKQSLTLVGLLAKPSLTDNQAKQMNELIKKRDAPPALSKGAKTYIKDVFFGNKFDYQKNFTNKFVEKGNQMEDPAIKQIVNFLGLPMVFKNEEHFKNDFIQGTPDVPVIPLNFQFDVKNVFYPSGLDSFTSEVDQLYKWQGHGYDWLTGVDFGMVIKILMNPPEDILIKEARTLWAQSGKNWSDPIDDKFMAEVRDYYDFEAKQPIEDRIKIFQFETTEKEKQQIREAVTLAREYTAELEELWRLKNVKEIEFIKGLIKK